MHRCEQDVLRYLWGRDSSYIEILLDYYRSDHRVPYLVGNADVRYTDVDEFWTSRWLWCVNGAHNRLLERLEPKYSVGTDLPKQIHRRVFVERCERNPMYEWNGRTYYTASQKLEHGKRRAIFSCDSVTYVNFEHLLRPIEHLWSNKTSILDPGAKGTTGILYEVTSQPGCNVMLDYDDFNSQHSLESIQTLFSEVTRYTDYPHDLATRLINSFTNSEVYVQGQRMGILKGTLMSGHRATSFINTLP